MKFGAAILGLSLWLTLLVTGCSHPTTKSPDVESAVRQALDQASLRDVKVNQDRTRGVIALAGNVPDESAKMQAESIAKSLAAGQVIANEIAVVPPGAEKIAKAVNSDLDKGIEKNLDAALVANRLDGQLKFDVKNRVVVLKGEVGSVTTRTQAESLAASVPNVNQVVNEVQVKDQKATSSK